MSNPVFSDKFMQNDGMLASEPMTVNGTISKTFLLMTLVVLASAYTWSLVAQGFSDKAQMLGMIGAVVAFISVFVIMFNRSIVNIVAPVYAVCEGLFLGGISAYFEAMFPGIVFQAVIGTFLAMFSMLFLYRTKMIRCTEKFRSVIFISTLSIAGIYLISFIGSFFGMQIPGIFGNGMVGIGFCLLVVVIAALNLIMDFDFIEKASNSLMPKNYEWYGAFGLLVTLVWLYVEFLRLLSRLRSR